ncbi:hypothetical protein CRE_30247 [Caenorhabditis remanei]|uniref:Uncharacterized protein n=1 Tax=Caenorhabditis remanei TaxID=31234 RepID=E3NKN3_CAERE|nr:hypothetical protein CRE_30247 [Caenorhabditis remanei]
MENIKFMNELMAKLPSGCHSLLGSSRSHIFPLKDPARTRTRKYSLYVFLRTPLPSYTFETQRTSCRKQYYLSAFNKLAVSTKRRRTKLSEVDRNLVYASMIETPTAKWRSKNACDYV